MSSLDIRTIRTETLKMSQAAFAAEMGVDQSTISNWEKAGLPSHSMIRETLERRLKALLRRKGKKLPVTEGEAA